MIQEMDNRNLRSEKRKYLFNYPKVTRDDGYLVGHIGDLSTHGMMLMSQQQLEMGKTHRLYLQIHSSLQLGVEFLTLPTQVRWIKPHVTQGLLCIGCEFEHLDEGQQAVIIKMSHEMGFDENFGMNRVANP